MDENKYLLNAYQKKSFELFNQSITAEAKSQHMVDLVELYKNKIEELVKNNNHLSSEIDKLRLHLEERENQIQNISKQKSTNQSLSRKTRKNSDSSEETQDAGTF